MFITDSFTAISSVKINQLVQFADGYSRSLHFSWQASDVDGSIFVLLQTNGDNNLFLPKYQSVVNSSYVKNLNNQKAIYLDNCIAIPVPYFLKTGGSFSLTIPSLIWSAIIPTNGIEINGNYFSNESVIDLTNYNTVKQLVTNFNDLANNNIINTDNININQASANSMITDLQTDVKLIKINKKDKNLQMFGYALAAFLAAKII